MKKHKNKIIWTAVLLIAAILIVRQCTKPAQPVELMQTKVEVTAISNSITATGTVEPVTQVQVGTQVSGIIDKLYVDYNSIVHKGQLLAELDKTNLENALRSAENQMNTAKTEYDYQEKTHERYKALHEKQLVSDADYEKAYYDYQRAHNSYEISKNDYNRARTNLSYAMIYSPIDGIVLSKEVEEGQTVAATMSTPTLFTIAQDQKHMRVIANVDEADIGNVVEGLRVSFSVDAYPDDVFGGTITQVRQKPTVSNNVVTYEVVIAAPNESLKLKPGLTANVTIFTMEDVHLLAISNAALRFTPAPDLIGDTYIIDSTRVQKEDETHKNIWQQHGDTLRAIPVVTGMTNGIYTEIKSGAKTGTKVIMGIKREREKIKIGVSNR